MDLEVKGIRDITKDGEEMEAREQGDNHKERKRP